MLPIDWVSLSDSEHGPLQEAKSSEEAINYSSWPIKELRRFLQERGHDVTGIVEKADLVSQVTAAAASGPEGPSTDAPAGFQFDPASGYFRSPESGMFWDSNSGAYCDASSGKWYVLDASSQQYVEWPQEKR